MSQYVVLGVAALLVFMMAGGSSPPPTSSGGRVVSLDALRPAFRTALERVLARLRAQGFSPVVWETARSEARARQLAAKGTGVVRSMHVLGLAADVLPAPATWAPASDPFWPALGAAAEAEGLHWGGSWSKRDLPHVQLRHHSWDGALWAAHRAGTLDTMV